MRLINGRGIAQKIRAELKQKIAASGLVPGLAVILVGDDPASHLYVKLKEKACRQVGIHFEKYLFPPDVSEAEITKTIEQLNHSTIIHGILVQLPLPHPLSADRVIAAIDPRKDVDGFHPENIRALKSGKPKIEPVLAKAIWTLITETLHHLNTTSLHHFPPKADPPLAENTLIIGKSDVFTESLEAFLKQKGLNASHLHPNDHKTANNKLQVISYKLKATGYRLQDHDIVVVAVGQPNFLRGEDFKEGAIVIDVGTNCLPDGRVVGDVDLESTKQKNGWITPVPGGVGPVTVAMLLENVYELSRKTG